MGKPHILFSLLTLVTLQGCIPFMHGFRYSATNKKTLNKYYVVHTDGFGSKRLQYSADYFHNTPFDAHIKKYGTPDMVYEYAA